MRPSPQIQFLGATGTVTGSKFLVSSGDGRVLVDCGMYQGPRELRERNWADVPVDPRSLDAVVLTHAHIDHCGLLPRLVARGFSGPVYATRGTAELAAIVLPDCGHLNEEEADYANRRGYSRHDPALPLYTEDEAWEATRRLKQIEFEEETEIAPDVRLRLTRAGHILGAATVALDVGAERARVVFSGDLGRADHPLLAPPDRLPEADVVVIESTYGDRHHDDENPLDALAAAINRTIERGGNVLIPAFAVDRTEVLLMHFAELSRAGRLPAGVPIFVDSPMALSALGVYREAIARGDTDIRRELRFRGDLFDVPNLSEVRDVEGSKALNNPSQPSIVISAAGMASGGRVVHHLAHYLADPRNSVLLVGYQAVGTRGRQLLDGATELKMMGQYVRVRADIVDIAMFSVHADSAELLQWVNSSARRPDTVFVVHGEPPASATLARSIRESLDCSAVVPKFAERVTFDHNGLVGAASGPNVARATDTTMEGTR